MRVGLIGIVAALLVGLLLAPGAANAAFVVPPAPTPPGPTPTAPGTPGTPAPPSGQAPNDTVPAPSSPEAPSSGPSAARQAPADALRALPFSTLPAVANAVTCYIVVDKVTPTKPVSNVVGQGCHNGPRIPPLLNQLLPGGPGATSPPAPGTNPAPTPAPAPAPVPAPRLRSDDGPNGVSAGAPDEAPAAAAQAASVPIAEFYAGTNYSGASFIIYGSGGGCDSLGYRLSDLAARNGSIGGASSYRTYNNCSNQAIHNQVDFGGTANFFTGYNRSSLPSGYDNAVRSARLASVPCTYYNETNASVCGVIRDKYNALGGPDGPLGFPTSNELTNPDGVGKRSTFQGATSIYWTPATGAHDVRGPLRDAWARNGWETGPLGYPLSDQIAIATGDGRTNRFFKNNTYAAGTPTRNTAAIYWSPATNARAVTGAVWDKYSALGGATSILGYPTSDEINTSDNGGKQNNFFKGTTYAAGTPIPTNGNIIWSAATGAWEVHGPVRAKYMQMNDVRGCNTYPISDVRESSMGPVSTFRGPSTLPAPWNTYTPRPDTRTAVSVHTSSGNGFTAGTATSSCDNDGSIIVRPRGQEAPGAAPGAPSTMPTPSGDSYASLGCRADAAPGSVCSGTYLANRGDFVLSFGDVANGTANRRLSAIQECAPTGTGVNSCSELVQAVVKGSGASPTVGLRGPNSDASITNVSSRSTERAPQQPAPAPAPAGWEMNGAGPAMSGVGACGPRCGQKYIEIDARKMPFIAQNIGEALSEFPPYSAVLTRVGQPLIAQNRAAACGAFVVQFPQPGPGQGSCDEYPFASSMEGGEGARVTEVPLRENRCQGGVLSSQYQARQILIGDTYTVLIFAGDQAARGPYMGVDIARDPSPCPPGDEE